MCRRGFHSGKKLLVCMARNELECVVFLTQDIRMIQNEMANSPALAMNGDLLVPVISTSHSLDTPAKIATILFRVAMYPNILLRLIPALSICRLWYSVTIQLSKALYIKLVLNPPNTLPKNRAYRFGKSVEKHATE